MENITENKSPAGPITGVCSDGSDSWREITVYNDGSGKAGHYYEIAIKKIDEWEEMHRVSRAFIAKHIETLAGLCWRLAYLEDTFIEISCYYYRGKPAKPVEIAMLWPHAQWKRVKEEYTPKICYDWEALVDGVTLRIRRAESEEPRPKLRDGETIRLPKSTDVGVI